MWIGEFKRRLRQTRWFQDYVEPARHQALKIKWWRSHIAISPPDVIKWNALSFWADAIGATTLVETGTFLGATVREFKNRFDRLVTIEIEKSLADRAAAEFAACRNVEVVCGDSALELPRVVQNLTGPTVFWLDAHWAGPGTGGKTDGFAVPIEREIAAIAKQLEHAHVIVIDDIRLFDGITDGYPTLAAVRKMLHEVAYWTLVVNDMLIAVPQTVLWQGLPNAPIADDKVQPRFNN